MFGLAKKLSLKVSSTLPSKLFDVSLHVNLLVASMVGTFKGFTQVITLVHPAQILHFS